MATEPLVYISLLNWNHGNKTLDCVQQLRQQSYRNFKIIVVDNASTDDSRIQLQQAENDIYLICSPENNGYASGHQLAMQKALDDGAELLWILNNDTQIPENTLATLVTAYKQHGLGIYGGIPLAPVANNERIVLMHYKYLSPNFREIIFDRQSFKPYASLFPQPEKIQLVAAISGSCFMLPLAIVRQHGFMDTRFFMYSEEVDYCFRLRNLEVPIWIVPQAIIWHEGEGSSSGASSVLSDLVQYYRTRNQLIRMKRYGSTFDIVRAIVKNLLILILLILRRRFRRARFVTLGMWDGIRGKLGKTFAPEAYI